MFFNLNLVYLFLFPTKKKKLTSSVVISRGKIARVSPISRAAASKNLTHAAMLATGRGSRKNDDRILTFGADVVVGPGVVDAHAHANEPGREEWEGLATATAAAAAGGVTTLIDMPLNSAPAATSARLLKEKAAAVDAVRARGEKETSTATTATATTATTTTMTTATTETTTTRKGLSADVGLWAGLVPSNARDPRELRSMFLSSAPSVLGFKAFLSPSGIGDFDRTPVADVEAAMATLRDLGAPLVLHAELLPEHRSPRAAEEKRVSVVDLGSWAASRPEEMEVAAVREVVAALERVVAAVEHERRKQNNNNNNVSSPSPSPSSSPSRFSVHIAHVAAPSALPLISEAKRIKKLPLTAETCPHYLGHFDPLSPPTRKKTKKKSDGGDEEEKIPESLLKCAPPLRPSSSGDGDGDDGGALWRALEDGTLDVVASDHSPTTPQMKRNGGRAESPSSPSTSSYSSSTPSSSFADAWGGISGIQYLLPATFSSSPLVRRGGPGGSSKRGGPKLAREEEDGLASSVHRWLSSSPARLAGLQNRKGSIAPGLDADLVAWKPSEPADVSRGACRLRHCENSPYVESDLGLRGRVVATFLRGQLVFREGSENDGDEEAKSSRLTGCGGRLVSRE